MEIGSITQIREYRDRIREKIKSLDKNLNKDSKYGYESEYVFKGIIGGIDSLLTDISTLTTAPQKFIKLSSYNERSSIIGYLETIERYLETPNNYISQFEALKTLLRSYNIRSISERQLEFEKEIEDCLRLKLQLQEELKVIKDIQKEFDDNNSQLTNTIEEIDIKFKTIETELETIIETKNQLISDSEELENINQNLTSIKSSANETLEEIKESLSESAKNEKLINSFSNKIHEKDNRLAELETATENNTKKLVEYQNERSKIISEAESLIESAKLALNYKTAEGISASFQEQYNSANNRWIFGSWIAGAIICLLCTIGLGIWILESSTDDILLLIARISLMPLPIFGTFFCANQYTKQKNIIEDYAYKMVLSKAIVGFSEQLKKHGSDNNEEYIHYVKTALKEIHKDPLRKRDRKNSNSVKSNLNELVEVAERIVKMSKSE